MAARLITEADVRNGRVANPIVVDRDTAITPSALDRATQLGIPVLFDRGKPSPGDLYPSPSGPGLTGSGLAGSDPLEDGQYLLTVKNGRRRLFRLTCKGPVEYRPATARVGREES